MDEGNGERSTGGVRDVVGDVSVGDGGNDDVEGDVEDDRG